MAQRQLGGRRARIWPGGSSGAARLGAWALASRLHTLRIDGDDGGNGDGDRDGGGDDDEDDDYY